MNLAIQLCPLTSDDQVWLWDVLYEALWDPPEGARRPREVLENPQIAAYVRDWGTGSHDVGFAAVTEAGERVGAVWHRLLLPPLQGGAFLDEHTPQLGIAVFTLWQGRGLGERLLRHHLAAARGIVPRIALGVHPRNERAFRLYERCGFTQFATAASGYRCMVVPLDL